MDQSLYSPQNLLQTLVAADPNALPLTLPRLVRQRSHSLVSMGLLIDVARHTPRWNGFSSGRGL
jgi:hypothetical protein